MKGIIALDIDGTITAEHHATPPPVIAFLGELVREGWQLVFITGRTFQWGIKALNQMDFSYLFAVNNGALLLEMPARKIVRRKYLARSQWEPLESFCADFVLYSGYESGDICKFRPASFSPGLLAYLKRRTEALEEVWIPVDSFDGIGEIAAAKCFLNAKSAESFSQKIEAQLGVHAPAIRDPFDSSYSVVQITHPLVSKGNVVEDCKQLLGGPVRGPVIAAGDDNNDKTMLAQADVRVVMATAPAEILAYADIVAPPATEMGIIKGLKEAIARYDYHRI